VRIATWNVNSMRARLDRVVDWVRRSDLDVVALQETKCREDQFPREPFVELGYEVAHHGHSQWNGVAVLSRVGLKDVEAGFPGMPTWGDPPAAEARALGVTCDGLRIWSLYVPNGRTLEDPHLLYKLDWLGRLRDAGRQWLADDPQAQIALVGDWNVAPRDEDVWNMAAFTAAHTCRRRSARPSTASSTPGTRTSSGRTRRASSRTGTTSSSASRAGRACGSTSCSPRRPSRRA
jgi:exodeoxyribonuclease-3